MPGERVDARIPVWMDGSGSSTLSRTLIGLRGPAGDQRLLVEVTEDGTVRLLELDLAVAQPTPPPTAAPVSGRRGRPGSEQVRRWLSWLLIGVIGAAAAALALGLAQASVVQSGSMEPTFSAGDVWVGISSKLREPHTGDVALFTARRMDGSPVAAFTHRIIGGNADQGFKTQGDANDQPDAFVVARSDISSVELFTVPFGGILVSLRPVLIALLALSLGLMVRRNFRDTP